MDQQKRDIKTKNSLDSLFSESVRLTDLWLFAKRKQPNSISNSDVVYLSVYVTEKEQSLDCQKFCETENW